MLNVSHDACCGPNVGRFKAARLLLLVFVGTAFVLNSYLAQWIYPDNRLAAEVSALAGALLLAAPILWTALRDVIAGRVHMNVLVSLAVLASFVFGDFRTAGVISFFMLISLVIERRTAEGAHASIESLVRLSPTRALRLDAEGLETEVQAAALRPGDRVRILPGDNVPADARILDGRTTLNEATITGESLPRDKGPGDDVFAGTQNLTGAVVAEVTRAGDDTTLGQVHDLILAAEKTRLPFMRIMDRYAAYYTPVILMIAALVWFFTDDVSRVVALLVISCPCALILASPTAMVAALSTSARVGVLVKHVVDLETTADINAVVFDKTGTLTTGNLGVSRLAPRDGVSPSELLHAAASVERFSKHPAAAALAQLAAEAELALAEPQEFHEEHGRGVRGVVEGRLVLLGRASWLREQGIGDERLQDAEERETEGHSVVFVASDGRYLGWIGMQDQVRAEASDSLEWLRRLQVRRLAMITGDRTSVARRVAGDIGCQEFRAECLPGEKVDFVRAVRDEGFRVAVVGDGVNDAPALATGHIGIAMGAAGSDVAIHSATVALMNNDLRRVPFLLQIARSARLLIYQNLGVALCFIVGGMILSGMGYLSPIVAALLHNVGSLVVVFNSARLVNMGALLQEDLAS